MAELRISRQKLREAGELGVSLIVERTKDGRDRHGQSFEPYSTKAFAMPVGGGAHGALKRLKDDDQASFFTTKKGALWAIVKGGYAAYKKERYGQDGGQVNLTATGTMLKGFTIIDIRQSATDGAVTLGFVRIEDAEKAFYHSLAGAGPSKTIRDFVGLTEEQLDRVTEVAAEGVSVEW